MARNRSEDFAAYPEDHYEDETVPAEFEHYVAGFIGSGDEQFVQIFGELNQDKQVSILTRPGGRVLLLFGVFLLEQREPPVSSPSEC